MNELHLFAGVGGGILGGLLCGNKPVCAVEINPHCQSVLVSRQNDGSLPPFPIWDDICTFDGTKWRGVVDMVSGGSPCQDVSCAGKGAGIYGQKSALWFEMLRVIREIRPEFAFVENSPMLVRRGLDVVLGGLAEIRYDAEWMVLPASAVGAPHHRERIWILAKNTEAEKTDPDTTRQRGDAAFFQKRKCREFEVRWRQGYSHLLDACKIWESGQPGIRRMDDGTPLLVEQFRAIGNAQVPLCAAAAFSILLARFNNEER